MTPIIWCLMNLLMDPYISTLENEFGSHDNINRYITNTLSLFIEKNGE